MPPVWPPRAAGVYPPDYVLQSCPTVQIVPQGNMIHVGSVGLTALSSPGHSRGHVAWYGEVGGLSCLFAGDSVFCEGRILLQNLPDCDLEEYCTTILQLDGLAVDALLPGHLMFTMREGQHHIHRAAEVVRSLRIPPSAL